MHRAGDDPALRFRAKLGEGAYEVEWALV